MIQQDAIDARLVAEIGTFRQGPCVSIYLPVVGAGVGSRQDAVRLRQLLQQAEERLTSSGMRREEAKRLLEDAVNESDPGAPWTDRDSSLALFIAPGELVRLRFRSPVEESVLLGRRFLTRPLLPDLALKPNVMVFAISRGSARLLRLENDGLALIDVPGMPPGLEATAQFEDPERQLQFHSSGGGAGAPIFHGHGGHKDRPEQVTREYVRDAWHAVEFRFRDRRNTLLVIAAPGEILGELQRLGVAADDTIPGVPERMRDHDLAEKVLLAARSDAGKRLLDGIARFNDLAPTSRTARHLSEVLPAAHQGRIEELFIAGRATARGTFDEEASEFTEIDDDGPETDDLLDLAANYTLRNGGRVHSVQLTDIPGGAESGPIAAILRG